MYVSTYACLLVRLFVFLCVISKRKVMETLQPAVAHFENVKAITEAAKDPKTGKPTVPQIQAGLLTNVFLENLKACMAHVKISMTTCGKICLFQKRHGEGPIVMPGRS